MLPLLLICLSLISTPALAKLAGTQAPFSKNDEIQTFIETVLRINRVFLRLSCRQLSSMQLWRSQKQADGEEFCFQMEEKPICRKKRQLVHLNRLQVAGRQKAKSWGARSGPASDQRPQTRGTTETTELCLCSSYVSAISQLGRERGSHGKDSPQRPSWVSLPTLTPLEHKVLLFCCCSAATCWCVLLKKIQEKTCKSPSHMANLLGQL